jgi:hypothetical protein
MYNLALESYLFQNTKLYLFPCFSLASIHYLSFVMIFNLEKIAGEKFTNFTLEREITAFFDHFFKIYLLSQFSGEKFVTLALSLIN